MTAGAFPAPELPADKDFYSIAQACRLLQVPAHTLRYWEGLFTILRPTRLPGGHRRYRKADVETAFRIKSLLRDQKLTAAGARKALAALRRPSRLDENGPGAASPAAAKILRRVRDDLLRALDDLKR